MELYDGLSYEGDYIGLSCISGLRTIYLDILLSLPLSLPSGRTYLFSKLRRHGGDGLGVWNIGQLLDKVHKSSLSTRRLSRGSCIMGIP